jgi:hypothetical protein
MMSVAFFSIFRINSWKQGIQKKIHSATGKLAWAHQEINDGFSFWKSNKILEEQNFQKRSIPVD